MNGPHSSAYLEIKNLLLIEGNTDLHWGRSAARLLQKNAPLVEELRDDIHQLYRKCPEIRSLYSKLAYALQLIHRHDEAKALYEKDFALNRSSWWFKLRYAELISFQGQLSEAELIVNDVYKIEPLAKNGYASVGWIIHQANAHESALKYFDKDREQARLTPGGMINEALVFASLDKTDVAHKIITKAYSLDSNLKDGYSRLAQHVLKTKDHSQASAYFNQDLTLGKQSFQMTCSYIHFLADEGLQAQAKSTFLNRLKTTAKTPNNPNEFLTLASRIRCRKEAITFLTTCSKENNNTFNILNEIRDIAIDEKNLDWLFQIEETLNTLRPIQTCKTNTQYPTDQGLHLGLYIGHDPGVALVNGKGQTITVLEESKFSGKKSTYFHPILSLKHLIDAGITQIDSLTWAIPEKPPTNCYHQEFIEHLHKIQISLSNYLSKYIQWKSEYFIPHHQAHAETAFWPSRFNKALVCVLDGSGEKESLTLFLGDRKEQQPLRLIEELPTSRCSYGHIYDMFTQYLGYRKGRGAEHCGKIMGLSSYGQPSEEARIASLLEWDHTLFPKQPKSLAQAIVNTFGTPHALPKESFSEAQANIASSLQHFLVNELLRLLTTFKKNHPDCMYLCLAGGVALNSLLNKAILDSNLFEDIFVQPCSSDTGLAYGAAHYGARCAVKPLPSFFEPWTHAYLGYQHISIEKELDDVLANYHFPIKVQQHHGAIEEVTKRLLEGRIIGCFQGQQEIGARALGHRSILALPTPELRDKVNANVKFREPWRPFAPVIRETDVLKYFGSTRPEPFMSIVYDVEKDFHNRLGGITHIDGTARVQTVNPSQHPFLVQLLDSLENQGIDPVLLNTSFNINGQPIVRTIYDALITFASCGIDDLLIGETLFTTEQHRPLPRKSVHATDRSLEPILRSIRHIDIALLNINQSTSDQLHNLLETPCITSRKAQTAAALDHLYYHPTSIRQDWEMKHQYGSLFHKVGKDAYSKEHLSDRVLLILTGDMGAMDYISNDFYEHEVGIKNALCHFNPLLWECSKWLNLDQILLLDQQHNLVPLSYYFHVIFQYPALHKSIKTTTFKNLQKRKPPHPLSPTPNTLLNIK